MTDEYKKKFVHDLEKKIDTLYYDMMKKKVMRK